MRASNTAVTDLVARNADLRTDLGTRVVAQGQAAFNASRSDNLDNLRVCILSAEHL